MGNKKNGIKLKAFDNSHIGQEFIVSEEELMNSIEGDNWVAEAGEDRHDCVVKRKIIVVFKRASAVMLKKIIERCNGIGQIEENHKLFTYNFPKKLYSPT